MHTNKICLIGNGFDLHFNLPTSYEHFEKHITQHYPIEKDIIEQFYNMDSSRSSLWSDFESNIANVDKDWILDYTTDPEEAQELYTYLVQAKDCLRELFENWVRSISCKVDSKYSKLCDNAFVINFNYTMTFEKNFNVPTSKIYHIHGTAKKDIIFGHKQEIEYNERFIAPWDLDPDDQMNYNELRPAFITWLNEYYRYTEKPVDEIIRQSDKLLRKKYGVDFTKIDKIIVIGLSYSDIDFPYIQWIWSKTNAHWELGVFNENDKTRANDLVKALDLKQFNILQNEKLIDQILE